MKETGYFFYSGDQILLKNSGAVKVLIKYALILKKAVCKFRYHSLIYRFMNIIYLFRTMLPDGLLLSNSES